MSTFRPTKERVCTFNFDDKFNYTLPLHEETARKLADVGEKQIKYLKGLKTNDPDIFDKVYNSTLDALDDIFGENAGADIMSIYEKPSIYDVIDVINYIRTEYENAYKTNLETMKTTGTVPTAPKNGQRGRR